MQQALALAERRIENRNRSAKHGHEPRDEPDRLQ
jgi:hypothetical protein